MTAPHPLDPDPFDNEDVRHLQLFLYLIPVVGFFLRCGRYTVVGEPAEKEI